jgi:transposase InsO family protein
MKLHGNARTCPKSRKLLVERVLNQAWSVTAAAEAAGVTERTVYRWLERWRDEGEVGLLDRSSRPRRSPTRLPEAKVQVIRSLRRLRMTAGEIAEILGLAPSTVSLWLKRIGLGKRSRLEPPEPPNRYERRHPGELVHVDIKQLGRISERGAGHRMVGHRKSKAARRTGGPSRGITRFEYVHVMVDNGSAYVAHAYRNALAELGLRHLRIRPYRPRTNGKAERFIQTLTNEWAYARIYGSSIERAQALPLFLKRYNFTRPHGSLGHQPPASRLTNLARNYT